MSKSINEINSKAAGIDIGSESHFVAIPSGEVREFSAFTSSLKKIVKWLKESKVETVAMESTGVYWIPLFEILAAEGFDVNLVDARQAKNLPGRKSDVMDCQWIQQLHSFGLLTKAFRPKDEVCSIRSLVRQKSNLVKDSASKILQMQKALDQMNIKLHKVVRYITGVTGMKIIRAILDGERDVYKLAQMKNKGIRSDETTIASALEGNYREEHLFALKQSLDIYDYIQDKIAECDLKIQEKLGSMVLIEEEQKEEQQEEKHLGPGRKKKPRVIHEQLQKFTGVDLTKIPGISDETALLIVSEIGNVDQFKSGKHFASWLGLCPGCKISGGRVLSSHSRNVRNRLSTAFRMSANALYRSKSGLGHYLRRMKAKHGSPKAITATAHKLSRIVYVMLKNQIEFIDYDENKYQQNLKKIKEKQLVKLANELGIALPVYDNCAITS
jgi:transposase